MAGIGINLDSDRCLSGERILEKKRFSRRRDLSFAPTQIFIGIVRR
jgi:hypothetical protein